MPAKLYVPTMEEVLVHLNARTCCWESIDPDEILRATAELCEKKRLEAISEQNLEKDTGALWVSEQHGRHVVEPGYLQPDTSVYHNWQLYMPADAQVFIAHLQHGPEDTAIGLGLDDETAMAALLAAYPAGEGKVLEVTTCAIGTGHASLTEAPVVCRTRR